MKKSTVLILLFYCLSTVNEVQANDYVKFDLEVNKKEIVQCECFKASLSLLVHTNNYLDLQFYDLSKQIPLLREKLVPAGAWSFDENIEIIKKERYKKHGVEFDRYKIYETFICPYYPGKLDIPSLELKVLNKTIGGKEENILSFYTYPISIYVKRLGQTISNHIYDNDFYLMVGKFKVYDHYMENDEIRVGDTIRHKLRLASFRGNAFPIELENISDEFVDIHVNEISQQDSIWLEDLKFSKEFELNIVPKRKGVIELGRYFTWNYYSEIDHEIVQISSRAFFKVSKKSKRELTNDGVLEIPNKVVALDVSESMLINDYQPNRLNVGIDLVNLMLKRDKNIGIVVFAGEARKIDESEIYSNIYYRVSQRGTAIGEAIYKGVQILKSSPSNQKRELIIIGDGDNTAGCLSISMAISMAKMYGIKIISVGIGNAGAVPFGFTENGEVRFVEDTYNDEALKMLADSTGGEFYHIEKYKILQDFVNEMNN